MPDFDELKDDAETYARQHPEQVEKGEEAVEKKLGIPPQGGDWPRGQAGRLTSATASWPAL